MSMRFKKFLSSLNNNNEESLKRLKDNYLRNLNYARKIQMALLPQYLPDNDDILLKHIIHQQK